MQFLRRIFIILICFLFSCEEKTLINQPLTSGYHIENNTLYYQENPLQVIGANTLHSFGIGSSDLKSWQLEIAREFIGNVKENPIVGEPILDSNNKYLHALQSIVDDNRANNLITILCPFGWIGTQETLFTGKKPKNTFWWNDYKETLEVWALHFKDQDDVWLEVWNEPYTFDRSDGYTDATWQNDMNILYDIIRNTGNKNIVVIPCAEQGQDETVLLNVGSNFMKNKSNVLFDVHAYEKWLLDTDTSIKTRLQNLKKANLPVFFGEVAPVNAGILMNPTVFLNASFQEGFSICAWLWKYDETDQDALLTASGLENNNNNNNWGQLFKSIATQERKTSK